MDLSVMEMHAVGNFPRHIREVIGPQLLSLVTAAIALIRDATLK